MAERIAITGLGIVSALGMNVQENLDSLILKKSGIGQMEYIQSIHKAELPVGEIKKTDQQLAEYLNIPYQQTLTRTTLLAMIAAKEAWTDAGVKGDEKAGVISATTVAGMRTSEEYYVDFLKGEADGFFCRCS